MKRTTIQRIFSILSYRKSREATVGPLSVAALAREYREHVKFAKSSEEVSETYIECATTVWDRALVIDGIRDMEPALTANLASVAAQPPSLGYLRAARGATPPAQAHTCGLKPRC